MVVDAQATLVPRLPLPVHLLHNLTNITKQNDRGARSKQRERRWRQRRSLLCRSVSSHDDGLMCVLLPAGIHRGHIYFIHCLLFLYDDTARSRECVGTSAIQLCRRAYSSTSVMNINTSSSIRGVNRIHACVKQLSL